MGGTNTAGAVTKELLIPLQGIGGKIRLGIFKVQGSTTYTVGGDIVDLRAYYRKIRGIFAVSTEDNDNYDILSYDDANYNTTSAVAYAQYLSTSTGIEITCATDLSAIYHRILVIGD